MPNLKVIAQPLTPEWHARREQGIGASEAAAAAGMSEYTSAYQLFMRKKGRMPAPESNDAMEMGNELEPIIWRRFEKKTGIKVLQAPLGLIAHPEHPFILATPDALVLHETEGEQIGESKTLTWMTASKLGENPDDVPIEWLCQAQQQLSVTGYDVCRIAVLLDGRTLTNYRIERDNNLIDALTEACVQFWDRLQADDPPPIDFTNRSTATVIKALFGAVHEKQIVELSENASRQWIAAQALKTQQKAIEDEIELLENAARWEMGNAAVAVFHDRTDKMLKRYAYPESQVAFTKKPYTMTKEVKFDRKLVAVAREHARYVQLEDALSACGYHLKETSESGSKYYCAIGKPDVRVSDHDPNGATRQWMDNAGVIDLRTDDSDEVVRTKLSHVL